MNTHHIVSGFQIYAPYLAGCSRREAHCSAGLREPRRILGYLESMKLKKRPLIEENDSHVRPGLGPQYVDRIGLDRPSFFSSPRNALSPPARDVGKISLGKQKLPTLRMSTPTQGGAAKRLLHEIAAQASAA